MGSIDSVAVGRRSKSKSILIWIDVVHHVLPEPFTDGNMHEADPFSVEPKRGSSETVRPSIHGRKIPIPREDPIESLSFGDRYLLGIDRDL